MLFFKKAYIQRTLRRNALRKGLLGGSPLWRAIWVLQLLAKGWGKISKKGEAPVTFDERLREGEAWAIVHEPELSRRGRGEGRKYLVGPRRLAPRANAMTGTALATIGKRIVEAPSAQRINEILGVTAVEEPPRTWRQRRSMKKIAKADNRMARRREKTDATVTITIPELGTAVSDPSEPDVDNSVVEEVDG